MCGFAFSSNLWICEIIMKITKQRYLELLRSEEILSRLEADGVDNWEWYGESLNPQGELSIRELMEKTNQSLGENDEI